MCGYKAVLKTWGTSGPYHERDLLRLSEYVRLKELLPELGNALPELDGVVPFYYSDHMYPLGALQCSECNPNDFYNW